MSEKTMVPTIGAALPLAQIEEFSGWLIEGQRDLEIQDVISADFLNSDWSAVVKETKAVLDGYTGRIGVHGPFVNITIAAKDKVVRAYTAELINKALDFCIEMGATHMVLHSPLDSFGDSFAPYLRPNKLSAVIENSHATLESVVPKAEAAGVILVIETIRDKNPQHLLQLVRSFESPAVQLSIDTGHAFIQRSDGGATPDVWVREAGELLAHLHIQDTDGLADRHWAPGDGNINWYAFFEAYSELSQTPRMVLEMKQKSLIMRGFNWLIEQGFVR